MRKLNWILAGLLLTAVQAAPADEREYEVKRREMLRDIETVASQTVSETGRLSFSDRVMDVIGEVPRHRFVPEELRQNAYENRPLGIGYGQTISQPYIVGLMTDFLEPRLGQTVLEVGTGSGYQAAVLAGLVEHVYSMEIIKPLAEQARERLAQEGYTNVSVRLGDGYYGWPEHAPFDAIIVTAAAGSIPPPLIEQLKPGGRMLIPVGGGFFGQQLLLVEKDARGKLSTEHVLPVRFVPLTGDH